MIKKLSAFWANIEMFCAACLACIVTLLILLNVVTRSMGAALFWVDELAIYAMVWMAFLGTSAALHYGHSVSITILTDTFSPYIRRIVAKLVDLIILVFSLCMVWFCWRWFAPLAFFESGFDTELFQSKTFNFIYSEPTSTLGIPKYLVWSVMWMFALGATLHSFSNLIDLTPSECPDK